MFSQIQYFSKGTVYQIRNRKTGLFLSASGSLATQPLQDTPSLLWVLSEVKNNQFEIIHMPTGDVLTCGEKGEAYLEHGRLKESQFWGIDRAEVVEGVSYFWMRPKRLEEYCLHGSSRGGEVKVSALDCTLRVCLWQFVEYKGNLLDKLSVIRSDLSRLVLDVPEHSTKEGVSIIQYLYHGRGNQRWKLEPCPTSPGPKEFSPEFHIRNYCSNLYLTAYFSKVSFRATQGPLSGCDDQKWVIAAAGEHLVTIQTVSNTSYYLGVSGEKGGTYITLTQDGEKALWQIEGYCPPL